MWLIKGTRQKVVLGGQGNRRPTTRLHRPPAGQPDAAGQDMTVALLVNKELAVVESNKQRLWAGPHGLPPNPRQVGVAGSSAGPGAAAAEPAAVQSVRVLRK